MRVGAREFRVPMHTVDRYQERVRPTLDGDALDRDLRRMLGGADIVAVRPAWVRADDRSSEWVTLGEDVVFPVLDGTLATCLTRSEPGDENRERMNRGRRDRAAYRAQPGVRKKHGPVARNERRRVRARKEAME